MNSLVALPLTPSDTGRYRDIAAEKIQRLFPNGCDRILLINPPQIPENDFDLTMAKKGRYPLFPPYGLGLLSRVLTDAGYICDILDLSYEIAAAAKDDPAFTFGLWKQKLDAMVQNFHPGCIGITCMFSLAHFSMKAVADYLKAAYGDIPIVAGGVHNSNNPKVILESVLSIDLIVRYEADHSFLNVIDFANGKKTADALSQLAMMIDGVYVAIDDRDTPDDAEALGVSPDYHNLPIGRYSDLGKIGAYHWLLSPDTRASSMLGNRGCRAQCTFCSVRNFNGKGVRTRAEMDVADEMQRLHEVYGIRHFMWLDDDLFTPSCLNLFNELTRRNLRVTWDASNGVIASAATREIIHAAAASGCIGLTFGIESGDPKILREVKKPSGLVHFRRVAEFLTEYPQIFTKGFLMVGFPEETIAQMQRTVALAEEILLDWYPIQVVTFLAGTEMTNDLLKKGVVDEHDIIDVRYFVGAAGGQRKREEGERAVALPFDAEILNRDGAYVPTAEEIKDIWFLMDYRANYRRIFAESDPVKLTMKRRMLIDVCARTPFGNPMAGFFLGVVNKKLGDTDAAQSCFDKARKEVAESAFWNVRFKTLGLEPMLNGRW